MTTETVTTMSVVEKRAEDTTTNTVEKPAEDTLSSSSDSEPLYNPFKQFGLYKIFFTRCDTI